MDTKALCGKCSHRSNCYVPCAPIEMILKGSLPEIFERSYKQRDSKGRLVTQVWPEYRQVRESELEHRNDGESPRTELTPFHSEANPFASYSPTYKQSTVFIQRYLLCRPYEEIADILNSTPKNVRGLYHQAVTRIFEILKALDEGQKSMTPEERKLTNLEKVRRYREKNRDKINAARNEKRRKERESKPSKLPEGQQKIIDALRQAGCELTRGEIAAKAGTDPTYTYKILKTKLIPMGFVVKTGYGRYQSCQETS